jgi:hypothetical protein
MMMMDIKKADYLYSQRFNDKVKGLSYAVDDHNTDSSRDVFNDVANDDDVMNPEGPEKNNNTEVKYGATISSSHTTLDTCFCEV